MRRLEQRLGLAAIAAMLAGAHASALGQDATLGGLTVPDSFVSFGGGYWSDERPQQGIYDGMRDKGA